MTHDTRKKSYATLFLIITLCLGQFVGLPGSGLSKAQEITAFILVLAAVLWVVEWVPLFVVSFLILALEIIWLMPELHASDIVNSSALFYNSFFSNIILLFIGGFVLSSLMQKFGLDLKFSQFILQRTKGHASYTLLGIILACSFLSMWMSNTATAAMMLTIVFPLIRKMPEGHKFRIALVLAIPFACNIGGIGTPIGTPPNVIALSYLSQIGWNLSFIQWMAIAMPFMLSFLFILWRLLLWLYPSDGIVLSIDERDSGGFGLNHWAAISIFVLTALGWFFSKSLGVKTGTIALFPIIAAFWLGLLDTADFRKLPWDVLYIISGGLALGVALDVSGLGQVLMNALPMDSYPVIILGITAFIAGLVMSNTATAGLMIPLIMSLNVSESFLLSLVITLALMCSMSMALPVATPPNAIAFSSRAISTKDMVLTGGLLTALGFVVLTLLGPWYIELIITNFF